MTRRERFWRWLHRVAEERIRDAYVKRVNHDRRCPHCGTWGALSPLPGGGFGWAAVNRTEHPMVDRLTCATCGQDSYWWEDMVAIPVKWPSLEELDFSPNHSRGTPPLTGAEAPKP